jgi:hypothetical protein
MKSRRRVDSAVRLRDPKGDDITRQRCGRQGKGTNVVNTDTAHTVKADANAIYNILEGVAREQLSGAGSVVPCGAFVRVTGTTELHMVVDDDAATQQDFEAALLESLRPLVTTGQVRAVGWCLDVRTRLPRSDVPTDAIVIVMEHRAGQALHCFIPYHRNGRGVLQYGEPFSAPASPRLFGARDGGVA